MNRNHNEGHWCGFRPARNMRLACVTGLRSRNRPLLAQAPEESGPWKPRSSAGSVAIGWFPTPEFGIGEAFRHGAAGESGTKPGYDAGGLRRPPSMCSRAKKT